MTCRSGVTRLGLVLLGAAAPLLAADPSAREDDIKAAFLFNFLKHVEWPTPSSAPLVIAVVGPSGVVAPLERIAAAATIGRRRIEVRRLAAIGDPAGLHLVFVPAAAGDQLEAVVATVRGRPILVVTEGRGATARGAAISLFTVDQRQRFEVDVATLERSGLKASAHLLRVAAVPGEDDR